MKRKIFLSINIPLAVQRRIASRAEKWRDLPVKWTKEANMHVSLFSLGHIETELLPEICEKVREAIDENEIFDLEFESLESVPEGEAPQRIQLSGKASEGLKDLHERIEKSLGIFSAPKKAFKPHIVVGRIRSNKWEELAEKPEIKEKFSLNVSVESVDVMASDFGEGESEYALIESCPLK
ncbi:MAG: RNA 2',3'-cyclic phosphodiesterase [Candidatus Moranbacteria bacterium]|nr:RNA 2',3'-cyclic phosphodiesterase [Candidatus Moranbacteria bacterium]